MLLEGVDRNLRKKEIKLDTSINIPRVIDVSSDKFVCSKLQIQILQSANKNEDGTTEWRRDEFDQVQNAIHMLKTDPMSRRIVVSTWHPGLLPKMALPPCHIMYIFNE